MADNTDVFAALRTGPAPTEQPQPAPTDDVFAALRTDQPYQSVRPSNTLGEEFAAGVGSGIDNLQGAVFGIGALVGRELDIGWLEEAGNKGAEEQFRQATQTGRESGGFTDIESAGGFFKWAAGSLGEAMPSLAFAATGGGIGVTAGKKAIELGVKKSLARNVERRFAKMGFGRDESILAAKEYMLSSTGQRALARAVSGPRTGKIIADATKKAARTGRAAGAVTAASIQETGSIDQELLRAGIADPGISALIGGVVAGSLEAVPVLHLMDKMFPGVDRQVSKQFVKDFAVASGTQAALEGSTEAAQELVALAAHAYNDPTFDMFSADAKKRVIDALAAGALVGAVTGGGGRTVGEGVQRARVAAPKIRAWALDQREKAAAAAADARARADQVVDNAGPAVAAILPEGFTPADNTAFQEIRARVYGAVQPHIEAAVNSLQAKVDKTSEDLDKHFQGGVNAETASVVQLAQAYHNKFLEDHKSDIENAKAYMDRVIQEATVAVRSMKDPEVRRQYIEARVELARAQLGPTLEKLRKAAQKRDRDAEVEIDNMDFDDSIMQELGIETEAERAANAREADELYAPQSDPDAQVGDTHAAPVVTFGHMQARPTIDNQGKETVRPYRNKKAALAGRQSLRKRFPDVKKHDDVFRIVKVDGGYNIEVISPEVKEDQKFFDDLQAVFNSYRRIEGDNNGRKVELGTFDGPAFGYPSNTKLMNVDVQTMAYKGYNIDDTATTDIEGFLAFTGEMLQRGMITNEQFNKAAVHAQKYFTQQSRTGQRTQNQISDAIQEKEATLDLARKNKDKDAALKASKELAALRKQAPIVESFNKRAELANKSEQGDRDIFGVAPPPVYKNKAAAEGAMNEFKKELADLLPNQVDPKGNFKPKGLFFARRNPEDGTWTWGFNPQVYPGFNKANPDAVAVITEALNSKRRDEFVDQQTRAGGDFSVNPTLAQGGDLADVRGATAGGPDATVSRTADGINQVSPLAELATQEQVDARKGRGSRQPLRTAEGSVTGLGETRKSMQKTDLLTDPSNLKNKLTPEFADREAELRATSSPKNKKTSPRASKPNPRTKRGREGFTMEQTKEDNALLKRYGTDKAFRSVLGGKWGFDTTSALSSVGHYVTRTLGLKGVVFVDDAGISSLLRTGAVKGRLAEALAAARDNPSVKAQNIRMHDNSFVYFSDQILGDQALSVLAAGHELGHQLYRVAWDKLSDSGKERLYSAYLKDKGVKVVDQADFNEWMADQLAAWITRPTLRGSEALQGATGRFFFQRVAENVRKLWNYIKNNKRWQLNETFNEFANAVALKAKTTNDPASNPYNAAVLREWFADGGVTMYEWFGKTLETDNMSFEPVTEAGKQALKRVETRYPKLAERAIPLRNWMVNAYNVALAPSTSVMRTMAAEGIWAADTLADMFHRKALGAAKGPTAVFIQDKQKMQGQFVTKMDEIVNVVEEEILAKNPGISNKRLAKKREAAIRRLGESLHKKDSDLNATFSETEQKVRNLMDDLHQYAVRSGLPVSYVPNYFPRAYDKDLLIRDEKKIIAYLQRQGVKNGQSPAVALAQAGKTYNSLVSDPNAMDGRASSDPRDIDLDTQTPGFAAMNSRTSKSTFWDQYLDNNVEAVVARYITQVVKRAEFNKRLGQPYPQELGTSSDSVAIAIREGSWDPKGKLHEILKEAANQGATPEQLTNMKKYIDANMGQLGRDLNPTVRKWMAGVVAYQNMRVLLFTVFASLPDMVGPAIRSGDMRLTWNALKSNIVEVAKKEGALQTQAETLGLIQSVANEHVMTEYVDNHYMPPRLRKWNQEFFKWTGLNYYTDFTRKYALAVGKSYLEKNMDLAQHGKTAQDRARGKDMLAELGVTPAQVQEWLDAGKPTYDSWSDPPQGTNEKVAEALIQFVDESIMRPNASQRPLLASDPRAMLVYHLKNFMYAIHDIILKRLKFNIDESKSPAQYMAALAPALMMMMLTAVGLELRELIQYAGSNRTPPTDRMDGWDYTWELAQRSGLTGTAQIAIDFEGADDRGMSHVAGLLGPAVGQVANVISRPSTQTVPKAIPVVSQIPALRDLVRKGM